MMIWSTSALANPIVTEGVRIRQTYDTQHVQLSVFFGDLSSTKAPVKVERDGQELSVSWVENHISLNTGSGVESVKAYQICDCTPGLGEHQYIVSLTGGKTTLKGKVTVVPNYPTPNKLDAGVPATDLSPWDEPEPLEMQGLDCMSACSAKQDAGTPAKDSGAKDSGAKDSGAKDSGQKDSGQKDSGAVKGDTDDDSGCNVGGGGVGLLALLALGLTGVIRRRV
ncbi:MAG: hypothetical protein CSA65_08385 [Proteobacteria bacterium]|nr:MAG: hypothetical protein CSA65_08385 [Pseudomonadota bacterium]